MIDWSYPLNRTCSKRYLHFLKERKEKKFKGTLFIFDVCNSKNFKEYPKQPIFNSIVMNSSKLLCNTCTMFVHYFNDVTDG